MHLPIIYVRGYAMTSKAVEETFNLPYYGFNLGSTQYRQGVGHEPEMHIFESPVIRLMKDHGYQDAFGHYVSPHGEPLPDSVGPKDDWRRTLWVFRYYDSEASLFDESRPAFPEYARRLLVFLNQVRQACGSPADFQVNLVAHSMGGLISRCYLQNRDFLREYAAPERHPDIDPELLQPVRVAKLFTYGTPHRGIRFRSALGPANWLRESTGGWREDQFTPRYMRRYLGLAGDEDSNVYHPCDYAPPRDRTFSLIGTNPGDYVVTSSSIATGPKSDGLVLTENAYIHAGPRAHVHKAHSGPLGLVNSEEGYQNLQRFLFGNARFQARLRFGRIIGRLPDTDSRDRLTHLSIEIGIAIRGLPGYIDLRDAANFAAEQILLVPDGEGCIPAGEREPVLYTGYLFAYRNNREHRAAQRDRYSRWVIDLRIKPHYERDRMLRSSRFTGDHFLADRLELALGDDTAPHEFAYRWQNQGSALQQAADEAAPEGVGARYRIPLPPPASTRYMENVELIIDISDWE